MEKGKRLPQAASGCCYVASPTCRAHAAPASIDRNPARSWWKQEASPQLLSSPGDGSPGCSQSLQGHWHTHSPGAAAWSPAPCAPALPCPWGAWAPRPWRWQEGRGGAGRSPRGAFCAMPQHLGPWLLPCKARHGWAMLLAPGIRKQLQCQPPAHPAPLHCGALPCPCLPRTCSAQRSWTDLRLVT